MGLKESKYIDEVSAMTLQELRQEVSNLNSNLVQLNATGEPAFGTQGKLASCALQLSNFFVFIKVDESKTYSDWKQENRKRPSAIIFDAMKVFKKWMRTN